MHIEDCKDSTETFSVEKVKKHSCPHPQMNIFMYGHCADFFAAHSEATLLEESKQDGPSLHHLHLDENGM